MRLFITNTSGFVQLKLTDVGGPRPPSLGGQCRSASAAFLIHRLRADNAKKNLWEWDRHVLAAFEKTWNNQTPEWV